MTKELDKAMLTPEEILAAPSGETVYNDDGSMDIRASRLNREIEIAKEELAKARPIIAEEIIGIIDSHNSIGYPYGADFKSAIMQVLKERYRGKNK